MNRDNNSVQLLSEAEQKAVRDQLDRILKSGPFHLSRRRQRFLQYLVNETLAGRGGRLKGYNVGLEVFDRPATFDPLIDPVVRIEAARLRDKLREYYETDGQNDPVRIVLPKGGYAPQIEFQQATVSEPSSGAILGELASVYSLPAESRSSSWRSALAELSRKCWWMLATAMLMIIVADFWVVKYRSAGPSLPEKPSIAVLPFDNIGDDSKWERFADGITEDIITDLAHSKDLIVIARNSTEIYRGKPIDIRQIGRDLNVKYVLEGSIQSLSERIRVTAQLIDAASGGHVWSERYDRPVDDLFAVQNDVTQRIATTLASSEGAVADAERILIRRKPPANLTAFDAYLLAMEAKHKVTKESLIEAEGLFRKAQELDPQLARAYYGLATVQMYLIDLGLAASVERALSTMMEEAEKAVELDPDDGKTHLALGGAYAYQGKSEQALAEFATAESLAPCDADLLLVIAWSLPGFGQSERAVSLAERSLNLNPHYPDWYNQGLSAVFFFGGQFDKAVKYRLLVKGPVALDYAFLAMANAYLGRTGDVDAAAANVARLDPTWIAEKYLSDGGGFADKEAEFFVDGARKSGLSDCVPADQLKGMPNLVRVKSCDQQRAKLSD